MTRQPTPLEPASTRPAPLELAAGALRRDGAASILLCSSVFPFRIPADQWDHRLQLVQESGYQVVDLYVHWGFHEQVPGSIDLTSPQRDLARFLELAAARGLLVMARPGPYICSETDGGGLPWWLHGDHPQAPAALRTTDPDYLAAVDRWFDAVLPILAAAQTTRGGPVALVQIENELDFFDCPDPDAYMTHLVERARANGIDVPVIACAGQGELSGASGDADGVVPTVNLYPADTSRTFDAETRRYAAELARRDLPLLVTETNRLHRTLRREILAGARLVAPYLQTSGFDHLVLPSAGNWGDPGNLMTHDYDFDGYVTPEGRRRPEYDEAIALGATLAAWGERLALAEPVDLAELPVEGALAGGALALPGGGHVVGPAELEDLAAAVRISIGPDQVVDAPLAPGTCPFWALQVPLAPWGSAGVLRLATAELVAVGSDRGVRADGADGPLLLVFEGGADARIVLDLPVAGGGTERLELVGIGEARSQQAEDAVHVIVRERAVSVADPAPVLSRAAGTVLPLGDALAGTEREISGTALPGAEALGLPDGRVQAELALRPEASEVLLLGAADLVRLVLDGSDQGVQVRHGAPLSLPLGTGQAHRLQVTAEIWGRANFDDARRPALRIGAGRGVGQVVEVLEAQDVTDLWEVREIPDRRARGPLAVPPLRGLGGWSSARPGEDAVYGRQVAADAEVAVLRFVGLTHPVHVAVDGGPEQLVVPDAPVLVLPTGLVDVAVRAPHMPGGLLERVELLLGAAPQVTGLRTADEAQLAAQLTRSAAAAGDGSTLPEAGLRVAAGAPALVRLDPPASGEGLLLELDGEDVQVTVVSGGRRVSRHVLGEPAVSGGSAHRSWIPAGWADAETAADGPADPAPLLLVEPLTAGGGTLRAVRRAASAR